VLNHRGGRERNLRRGRCRRRSVMVVVVDDVARVKVPRYDAVVQGGGRRASLHGCGFVCLALNPPCPARSPEIRLRSRRFGRTVLQASNDKLAWGQVR